MKSDTAARLERGRLLFNEGRFFEAHEVWEDAWRVEDAEVRTFLQGLIQVAAGFHKAGGGTAIACARLLEAGLEKLSTAAEQSPAVRAFGAAVRESLEEARRWERGEASGVTTIPALPPLEGVK